jgi:SpoVK/Ycf46/Vps4 family AAA+-type ATPase
MIMGYALFRKIWVLLEVSKIHSIDERELKNQTTLQRMVVPHQEGWLQARDILSALISCHGTKTNGDLPGVPAPLKDIVEGKGQGLVILLHGASGTGKTLTAEAIAQSTGRPLLKITVSDIGLDVTRVEGKLEEFFSLAARWQAILLFDEADIFLLQREKLVHSFERNSLVSVFLKVLEYFEGVLILTTNRVKTFDFAVQSRIHLALEFPGMGTEEQKEVFEQFLSDVGNENMETSEIKHWLKRNYESPELCGREIRNLLASAIDIARADHRRLRLEDIQEMRSRTVRFKKAVELENKMQEKISLTSYLG